jgi:hypothetical protein
LLKGPNQLDERVPIEVGTIQVNFCKNPQCQNFGVPASTKRQPRGRGAAERGRDTYSVVGSGRGTPMLRCSFCGQYPTIKSNKAIHEELSRFWKPFDTRAYPTCSSQDCSNHHIDIEKGKTHYHSFGRTKAGSFIFPELEIIVIGKGRDKLNTGAVIAAGCLAIGFRLHAWWDRLYEARQSCLIKR